MSERRGENIWDHIFHSLSTYKLHTFLLHFPYQMITIAYNLSIRLDTVTYWRSSMDYDNEQDEQDFVEDSREITRQENQELRDRCDENIPEN